MNDTHPPDVPPDQAQEQQSMSSTPEPAEPAHETLYLYDVDGAEVDEGKNEQQEEVIEATPYVAPFQFSGGTPTLRASSQPSPVTATKRKRISSGLVATLIVVVVILGAGIVTALAVSHPLKVKPIAATSPVGRTQQAPRAPTKATPPVQNQAQNTPGGAAQTTQQNTDEVPQLPAGWTNAGLQTPDAIQADYTAGHLFTAREEDLDSRSVGTRDHHGGTMTAAVFIMTTAAKVRFAHNDVRVINNVLFDDIEKHQTFQSALNLQAHLTQFQGRLQVQQQFAWVDVRFQLWKSQVNDQGVRVNGFEVDPTTNQPLTHHMMVLLLRIPPQIQGANAPAGGTGWLVSTYALDPAGGALPAIPDQP